MSEPTDALKDVRHHLNERARAKRTELDQERARRNHARQFEQLKREVRECGELVRRWPDGLVRRWPDFKGNWELASEACGEGERVGERWSDLNRMTCKVWVRRWRRVAWLIRQKGLCDVALNAQPNDPLDVLTHGLFARLLSATDWREMLATGRPVAAELARVRSDLARMASRELPDVHFELANYFDRWLWPRIDAALRDRAPAERADSALRIVRAGASLEWALALHPEWESDPKQVHAFIKSSGVCPAYAGCRVPGFDTWERYERQSRSKKHR